MAVLLETSLGDLVIDLLIDERPKACLNFLKLCKIKYYNYCLFHAVKQGYIAQAGDPTNTGEGGSCIWGIKGVGEQRLFAAETVPRLKHIQRGTVSMVNDGHGHHSSQWFITLGEQLDALDSHQHTVFGYLSEGFDILSKINEAYCDKEGRPYRDIRINHTVILDDPFDDPPGLLVPSRSPSPTPEQLKSSRIGADEALDDFEGMTQDEIDETIKAQETAAHCHVLEMVGDIPDAEIKPPDNVLFVCKLNAVTTSEDLETIFSRFGPILSCEVIRDQRSGESLQYAFIEFEKTEDCEEAYFKMDNVLIDERRIHVDFSQSVSKVKPFQKVADKKEKGQPEFRIKSQQSHASQRYEMVFDDVEAATALAAGSSKRRHGEGDRAAKKLKHDEAERHSRYDDDGKVRSSTKGHGDRKTGGAQDEKQGYIESHRRRDKGDRYDDSDRHQRSDSGRDRHSHHRHERFRDVHHHDDRDRDHHNNHHGRKHKHHDSDQHRERHRDSRYHDDQRERSGHHRSDCHDRHRDDRHRDDRHRDRRRS